ncbi:MAG TPA: NAD(P)-binding domain-containing protein [Kofleriaceae bacterium]|nr:NAD(P)-binding domain-containing protein [Kofleriaceae bacterium]
MTSVGVIGLGRTGLPVAANLVARGHQVIGFRRRAAGELAQIGGTLAAGPREVAERATTILLVLPSVAALDDVMTQILPVLGAGHVVVALGSHPIADKQRHREHCAARGAVLLDGEISGTPAMTAARRAVVLIAGDPVAAEPVVALCRDASDHAHYVGAFGAATRLKLVANHLVAVHTAAAAEAMLLVERSGIDPALAIAVLGAGAGGSTMWSARAPSMAARQFVDPAPGPVGMLAHYLAPIEDLAGPTSLPLFAAAAGLYRAALAQGRGDHDIACVIELLDTRKGQPS